MIGDDDYLNTEFVSTVQQRGAAIIKASIGSCGGEWGGGGRMGVCVWSGAATPSRISHPPTTPARPQARGLSSALSAGSSACDHIRNWVLGTPGERARVHVGGWGGGG